MGLNLHPRRKIQEYGRPESDFLPSEITYVGANSGEHVADYARFQAAIGENTTEGFSRAYRIVADNGYRLFLDDVPDVPTGAKARFQTWVREHVSRHLPVGLAVYAEWFS